MEPVQETASAAAIGKLSAISLGYYKDDFLQHLVPAAERTRRPPLLNRGHWARVEAIWSVLNEFLAAGGRQVVNLGCGMDTMYYRLCAEKKKNMPSVYVEVDVPASIAKKKKLMQTTKKLARFLPVRVKPPAFPSLAFKSEPTAEKEAEEEEEEEEGKSPASPLSPPLSPCAGCEYVLLSADLRDLPTLQTLLARHCPSLDRDKPTLFLSECVLVYMEPEESAQLISWVGGAFASAVFLTYEQIRPHDPFGKVMMAHLTARGCSLKSLQSYPDPAAQERRFVDLGWARAACLDMQAIYTKVLPSDERRRIEKIELFDEFEEWDLFQAHYCMVLAATAHAAPIAWLRKKL